jgi:hypothetical protein
MAAFSIPKSALLDLPLEELVCVCQQLDVRDLVRVAAACKRLRHGDGSPETAELPTKSPVVTALLQFAFPGGELVPSTRPTGFSGSWIAYLARCARQRRCREAPLIAAGQNHSVFVDAAGRLLACGSGAAVGHGDADSIYSSPTLVAAMASVQVRSVAAGSDHSLALGWDGRVYSWGENWYGQLGHGDKLDRPSPALVERLEDVRGFASAHFKALAVTQSGDVFHWGAAVLPGVPSLRPIRVKGFGEVRIRGVHAGWYL